MRALPDPQRAKPCVLVVDDDEAVGLAIAARLGHDFRVVSTTEPAQAVAIAVREDADVVLCDVNMPGMQGDEVAYAMSLDAATATLPLIYLTALFGAEDADQLDGQFGDYPAVSKDASTAELRAAVEQALGLPSQDD